MVSIKRIYDPAAKADGYRILVDRLWPRGIKKENAHIDKWLKEIAPSTALRKWFNHELEKWKKFKTAYQKEIKNSPALEELLTDIRKQKTVTLLFSAKEEKYNQAVVLLEIIKKYSAK
jgi:uncharacterized protein YeaO (DUF488 family)